VRIFFDCGQLQVWSALLRIFAVLSGSAALAETPLTTVRVASGLSAPVYVTHAPADPDRIFIVEQTGRIRVLKNDELLATPFLDIRSLVTYGGEQGLLGLAFHPNYASNGFFYVNYTDVNGNTVVARFHGSGDQANAGSWKMVMTIAQPFSNHNGGWLAFGPDGFLYIATGDGGDAYDPESRAQNTGVLLGKILRINVNADSYTHDDTRSYAIPLSNPFVGTVGLDEIWAYGLRNPWRPAFDRATGDLYIADVGQNLIEEIDFQPASSHGGENYGWRCMEGDHCNGLSGCVCNDRSLTLPIFEYSHDDSSNPCAITGGEVYRGSSIPDLAGTYFFADYCSAHVFSFSGGASVADFQERTTELNPCHGDHPNLINIQSISSFGQDFAGEMYICDLFGGEVFKIIRDEPLEILTSDPPSDAIDARIPAVSGEFEFSHWRSAALTFNEAAGCVDSENFDVKKEGGQFSPPSIVGVVVGTSNPHKVTVKLSSGVETRSWVTIEHLPSGNIVRLGSLPGDVDTSATTTPLDILALIDALNHPTAPVHAWSVDIDDSGVYDSGDIFAELDLLRGTSDFDSYLGAKLP